MRRRGLAALAMLAACACTMRASEAPAILDVLVDLPAMSSILTPADFSVRDAQGPLTIESVEPEDRAAADPVVFAIFLDEFHLSETEDWRTARTALARAVRSGLGPRDLVVVLKPLDSLTSIQLTPDREAAAQAIESARGRRGDYSARTPFERDYVAGTPGRIDDLRARIAFSGLGALVAHVARLPGARKTLLVLSDGFPIPATEDVGMPGTAGLERSATVGRVAIYVAQQAETGASTPAPAPATATAESAGADGDSGGALRRLAEATTGFSMATGTRFAADLDRMLRDARRYYVLAVRPRIGEPAGRFTPVTVSVAREGAAVRGRRGFSIVSSADASARAASPPPPLTIPRRTSPLIRTWFGLAGAGEGRTRVSFVWEPAAPVPGAGPRRAAPQTVAIQVTTLSGEPVFVGRTGPASAVVPPGEAVRLSFETDPARLLVQMEILDASGRLLDRDVRDLAINRFQAPIAFGTPEVLRTHTARALRPLVEGAAGVPTVSRDFSRAEHLVVRVPIVGEASEVRAALESGLGGTMRELAVTRLASDPAVVQVDFPLAGLASGRYAIRIEAAGPAGRAADRLTFAIRP